MKIQIAITLALVCTTSCTSVQVTNQINPEFESISGRNAYVEVLTENGDRDTSGLAQRLKRTTAKWLESKSYRIETVTPSKANVHVIYTYYKNQTGAPAKAHHPAADLGPYYAYGYGSSAGSSYRPSYSSPSYQNHSYKPYSPTYQPTYKPYSPSYSSPYNSYSGSTYKPYSYTSPYGSYGSGGYHNSYTPTPYNICCNPMSPYYQNRSSTSPANPYSSYHNYNWNIWYGSYNQIYRLPKLSSTKQLKAQLKLRQEEAILFQINSFKHGKPPEIVSQGVLEEKPSHAKYFQEGDNIEGLAEQILESSRLSNPSIDSVSPEKGDPGCWPHLGFDFDTTPSAKDWQIKLVDKREVAGESSGLQNGDIINSINGKKPGEKQDFTIGQKVKIVIDRAKATQEIEIIAKEKCISI